MKLDLEKLTYHVVDDGNGKNITCTSTCKRKYNKGTKKFDEICSKMGFDNSREYVVAKEQVCKVLIHLEKGVMTISQWFTEAGYGNNGAGKATLKEAVQYIIDVYGKPDKVEYIWNGANEYVLEWLEKFDAECKCPIAVQKTQAEDDWDSHEYKLNAEKLLTYLGF